MLFHHQEDAVVRYRDEDAIPLFFSPGLGKTCTSIMLAVAKYLLPEDNKQHIDGVLVIAPNGVHKQWATQEIPKWMSPKNLHEHEEQLGIDAQDIPFTVQWRKNKKLFWKDGCLNFACTNIETFSTVSKYMDYVEWTCSHKTMIVLDEATRIKNMKATRTQRLLYEFNTIVRAGRNRIIQSTPKTVARIILTGTPVTNSPFDLYSMMEFLVPSYYGMNEFAFKNYYGMYYTMIIEQQVGGRKISRNVRVLINEDVWNNVRNCDCYNTAAARYGISMACYDTIIHQEEYKGPFVHIDELVQKTAEIATFIKVEDVLDMPERTYIKKILQMSTEQNRVYREMESEYITLYKDEEVSARTKMAVYIRLQQIACGFVSSEQPFDPEGEENDPPPNKITWIEDNPRIPQLLDDIQEITGGPDTDVVHNCGQVIVVCHFSAEAEMIYDRLIEEGYKVCLMTGWKKVGSIDGFQKGKYHVMVANIRVISTGFNLQEYCYHMIFYSNTFSLEDRVQVEARIYRTGQKNRCIYYDYIMEDTIDMKIYAALKQHKELYDYVTEFGVKQMLHETDDAFWQEFKDVIF